MSHRLDHLTLGEQRVLGATLRLFTGLRDEIKAGRVPLEHHEAAERELLELETELAALFRRMQIDAHYDAGGDLDSLLGVL
jgi:hypothetical protein